MKNLCVVLRSQLKRPCAYPDLPHSSLIQYTTHANLQPHHHRHSLVHPPDEEEGPLIRLLVMLGTEPITAIAPAEMHGHGGALVFLNGTLVGVHRRPHRLVREAR